MMVEQLLNKKLEKLEMEITRIKQEAMILRSKLQQEEILETNRKITGGMQHV